MYITYGSIAFVMFALSGLYYFKYKKLDKVGSLLLMAAIVFLILAGLEGSGVISTSKRAGSFYRRYVRPRTYRGRTDYDKYISCISEGGYWLDGMCSTVSLPGSQSLQALPFAPGYYDNYPSYYFPSYGQRHRYWPRRRYQKRYGGYLNG